MIKKIFLLNFFFLFILGCNNEKSDEQYKKELFKWSNKRDKYDSVVVAQTANNERIDEIFLDFHFGYSKSYIDNKLKNLLKEGKLQISHRDKYQYELSLSPYNIIGKGLTTFSFYLIDNKLYKLELRILGYDLSDYEKKDFCETILKIYKDKYDNKWFDLTSPRIKLKSEHQRLKYKMIESNLEITIANIVDGWVRVEYIDKIAEQQKITDSLKVTEYSPRVKSNKSLEDL